jgi:hypothetical protein
VCKYLGFADTVLAKALPYTSRNISQKLEVNAMLLRYVLDQNSLVSPHLRSAYSPRGGNWRERIVD